MPIQESQERSSIQQLPPEPAKLMMAGVFNRAAVTYGQVGAGYFAYFGQRLVELVITCAFSLFFLSDLDAVLSAFRRILRPGGCVALSIWAEETPTEIARWRWYDDLVTRFASSSGSSPLNPGREMDTPDQMAARLTRAGFADVRVQSETKTFAYTTADDWWQERWSLFFRIALERLSTEALTALHAEALAHARIMQEQGALLTERNVLYVVARK